MEVHPATLEKVCEHVLEHLKILSPGGGFVFNTIHNILPEVSPGKYYGGI